MYSDVSNFLFENFNIPDVKQEIHKVLEGGGHVLAAETSHVLSHVSSENLVKRRRLLAVVVDVLRNFLGYEIGLLQGLDQVPRTASYFHHIKHILILYLKNSCASS